MTIIIIIKSAGIFARISFPRRTSSIYSSTRLSNAVRISWINQYHEQIASQRKAKFTPATSKSKTKFCCLHVGKTSHFANSFFALTSHQHILTSITTPSVVSLGKSTYIGIREKNPLRSWICSSKSRRSFRF